MDTSSSSSDTLGSHQNITIYDIILMETDETQQAILKSLIDKGSTEETKKSPEKNN